MKQQLTRREFVLLTSAGIAITTLGACRDNSSPARLNADCVLTAEATEGPFYTDKELTRSDITDGKTGTPLELQLTVIDATTCAPLPDAAVDVWHADAIGLYSAFTEQGDDGDVDTTGETFLRGTQVTNAEGAATFTTIYPGWYPGRTTHIHVKVHLDNNTLVTSQLYFPDDLTAEAYNAGDYIDRGDKDTSNDSDRFGGGNPDLMMTVVSSGAGFTASHTIGVDRS